MSATAEHPLTQQDGVEIKQADGQPCDPEGEDLLNAATFSPPTLEVGPNVFIEYCDRVSLH